MGARRERAGPCVPPPVPAGRCPVAPLGAGEGGVRRGEAEVPLPGTCEGGRAPGPPPPTRGCWAGGAAPLSGLSKPKPKVPAQNTRRFLHKIVDGICGRAYPRYQDYGSIWSLSEWMEVLEETMTYFKTAVGENISDEEAAQQINELNPNYQKAITRCLNGRKEEIRNALVERVNAISSAQLQDFDWQLKLALSSDKISMLQMPLLNLDLDVRENGGMKQISIEMNKEELQNLINALEAANKVVLQLK